MSSQSTLKIGSKKSNSESETKAFGFSLGTQLIAPTVIALYGDLGAGKTTLIKGIASGYANLTENAIQSPTFTLHHIYDGEKPLHHFDLYRLKSPQDFIDRGFEDELFSSSVVIIEWAERIESLLPKNALKITIKDIGPNNRTIEVA
ncbi:MAG: tRNA (adenosine(37)-N6)-threonylcarbamoyltransferase complex ATPase subunit type 1 TsaE [Simkaniaceae bacterium]|nr:tRNA (adenosine(37)-N6)-threonylcarbamoyltransferase complex ATPase subunit type 1 TsaE [Simkaniaceae bacterium]